MPGPAAHVYTLAAPITTTEGRTAAQMALLWYLRSRELEGKGGATQAQMTKESHLAPRTVGTAVRKLVKEGAIK